MSDLKGLWIGLNYLIIFFKEIFKNMFTFYLIKKKIINFFLNIYYYFYLFIILKNHILMKINTIIDIVATHYPDNSYGTFELLYVIVCYKLNQRFFFKLTIKKENLLVSLNNLFNSTS